MKNSEYWAQRFSQLENAQNGIGTLALSDIEKQYRKAQKQIEKEISTWYQRFAKNNGITLAEAKQYLSSADLKELKWDVQDYIKYGQENAVSGSWIKQLENASSKYHISKLEALKIQTQNSLETMFAQQGATLTSTLQNVYTSGYYHTAYELQKGFGIGFDISGVDQSQLEKILSKPWAVDGYNFSERIWNNKDKLISTISNELTQNIMLGKDPQNAIDAIAKQMNTSKSNAGRLVMTEEAYFSSLSQKDCFNELGVEEYEIVATLDSRTSDICQSMDGQHFPMKDYQAGVTAPPFHVWCRSTTAPYFEEQFDIGERAARDENGNTYYVPDDMNYQEWKETFVDGGDKSAYTVIDDGSALHYKKDVASQATTTTPKKEYLTENKLKAKIADADVQIDDLKSQADSVLAATGLGIDYEYVMENGGIDTFYSEAIEADKYYSAGDEMKALEDKYGSWDELLKNGSDEDIIAYDNFEDAQIKAEAELNKKGFTVKDGKVEGISKSDAKAALQEKAQLDALQQQITDLETQKTEWQTKLNEKLIAKEKKALTKQQMELEAQKAALQQQLDDFDVKTYSGIWKNDVTTADFSNLNVAGKKSYYEGKFLTETDPDLLQKYHDLYDQLEELETEGKSYADIQSELNKIETEIKKVQSDLTKLDNGGIIDSVDDAFTQERKDAALWAKSTKQADDYLRDTCGEVWRNATQTERDAIYDYTISYHKFNEPLRGIEYGTSAFKGVGNINFDKIGVSYSGYSTGAVRKEINAMTDIIEKSTYDFDMWVQRGCDYGGMDKFFEIPMSDLMHSTQSQLEKQLLGKTVTDYGFFSCGVSKGKGFSHKPIIMNVYAPKGTQMMYVEPFSEYGMGAKSSSWDGISTQSYFGQEAEIILQQGTSFRVTKVEKSNGKLYVDIEVISQNTPQR